MLALQSKGVGFPRQTRANWTQSGCTVTLLRPFDCTLSRRQIIFRMAHSVQADRTNGVVCACVCVCVRARARALWHCRRVSNEAVDSADGDLRVDIVEEGCTQHSGKYPGGMQLVQAQR